MFRRSALLAAALVVLVSATASASTVAINITQIAYPPSTTVALGDTVQWNNQTSFHHTSTSDSPLSLWSRDMNGFGTNGSVAFTDAGSFPYHCNIHSSMHGKIVVPMKVQPSSGTTATMFAISVATVNAPAGYKYVIQRKAPGGLFAAFKSTTSKMVAFKATSTGKWSFRARLKHISDGAASGWSPTLTIQVHA